MRRSKHIVIVHLLCSPHPPRPVLVPTHECSIQVPVANDHPELKSTLLDPLGNSNAGSPCAATVMESGSAESGLDEAGEGNSVEPVKEKVPMTNQCRFLRGIRLGVGICLRISKLHPRLLEEEEEMCQLMRLSTLLDYHTSVEAN